MDPTATTATTVDFSPTMWVMFLVFVLAMLGLDLGIFNRKAHVIKFKEAVGWSIFWICLAFIFNGYLYYAYPVNIGHEFLAGYLLEKALSVDNIFVFIMLFTYFQVEPKYQHRLLFWGIVGALVLRGAMIAIGNYIIHFQPVVYAFGLLLIYTGYRMATHDPTEDDPSQSFVYRYARKLLPFTEKDYGQKFIVKENGKTVFTKLFLVLIIVETTDVLFALDSIPAVFAVTQNPFIVFTSNVFAILGLRALYFLLAGIMGMFRYLKYGLSIILVFVGVKMLLAHTPYKIDVQYSLITIGLILVVSVAASVLHKKPVPVPEEFLPDADAPPKQDAPDPEDPDHQ